MKKIFDEFPNKKQEMKEAMISAKEKEGITFENASTEIKLIGYRLHAKEHDPGGKDPKIYHTSEHPRTLERYAKKIAEILNLSPQQRAITEMAIAWHDTIIEYDKADPNNLLAMIRRHRGARENDKPSGTEGNEGRSAQLLEQEMRNSNKHAGKEIFTDEQIHIGRWAIDATYPDVNFGSNFKEYPYYEIAIQQNPALSELFDELKEQGIVKGPLFFQPHLETPLENGKLVPREVLITALVDLGVAGLAEKEEFFKSGDEEMRELYANLRRPEIMRRLAEGNKDTDRIDREKVMTALISWLDNQIGFAAWQSLRFEKNVYLLKQQDGITPEEEQSLHRHCSHYVDNIRATCDRAKELNAQVEQIKSTAGEKQAFLYLARSMHYEI